MILGFTGTRKGMSLKQKATFKRLLYEPDEDGNYLDITGFLNGACVGADRDALTLLEDMPDIKVELYPGDQQQHEWGKYYATTFMNRRSTVVHPIRNYLQRNKVMVERSDLMIATPGSAEEVLRSGTWATIRYARIVQRPLKIIQPDGQVVEI